MTTHSRHWAAALIGKPWRSAARGPLSFDCRGLADWCCQHHFDEPLPSHETVHASPWSRVEDAPRENDVLLMRNKFGERHIGWMTLANGRLGVLHADGHDTPKGPVGSVVWQTLADATAGGYHEFEIWRRA